MRLPSYRPSIRLLLVAVLLLPVVAVSSAPAVGGPPDFCQKSLDHPNCNNPPIVDAGPDVSGEVMTDIALDGTVSDDAGSLTTSWSTDAADCSFADPSQVDTTVNCGTEGTFTVTLTADDGVNEPVSDSATVTVSSPDSPPSVDAGPDVSGEVDQAIALDGTVSDDGSVTTSWTADSSDCSFADANAVDTSVTCTAAGDHVMTLTADDGVNDPVSDSATASVTSGTDSPAADVTLSGDVSFPGGFTIPAGEVWEFDPNVSTTVTVDANVIVEGRLEMKPASADIVHTLKFVGIDETQFVGGDTTEPLATDVGLWVVENGQLDLQGTPRAGWNRTGTDSTWRSGDEIRVAPQAAGDSTTFASFIPGDPVPSVTAPDGSVHYTEVFNLTRNVRIHGGGTNPPGEVLSDDGRAHVICLRCQQPQTVKYVELRWVGPRAPHDRDGTDGRLGRYGFHFHHGGNGPADSIIEGVVVRDAGNHAFVPHMAHGVTFRETIAFDTFESAYWWDPDFETNDLLIEHAAAFLTQDYPASRSWTLDGFTLGEGINMTLRHSVVAGSQGQTTGAGGFHWPEWANHAENNVWTFQENVAHNNRGHGLSAWQNDANAHIIEAYVGYRNGHAGISHGAYRNNYLYRDALLFDNGSYDLDHHALGDISFENLDLGSVRITKHTLASEQITEYRDLTLRGAVTVDENIDSKSNAGIIEFHSSASEHDLSPSNYEVVSCLSDISVHNSDGTSFSVC